MAFIPYKCRIPELLRERRITATEAAEELGMTIQQFSNYANMQKIMSLKTAKLFAEYFMIPIDDLYIWKHIPPSR